MIVKVVLVLELNKCSLLRNPSPANFRRPWKLQHRFPFKHIIFLSNYHLLIFLKIYRSHKKRKLSLETKAKQAVLCAYLENQATLELVLHYRASKCRQTKYWGSQDSLFTLYWFKHAVIKMCHNRLQFVKKHTQISAISNTGLRTKLHVDYKILFYYFLGASYAKISEETFKYHRAS